MTTITMMEFRKAPGEIIDRMRYFGEVFTITRQGKPVAYLMPIQTRRSKPTADELERILFDRTFDTVEILPDGSVVATRIPPIGVKGGNHERY